MTICLDHSDCWTNICCRGICDTACVIYDPWIELFTDPRYIIFMEIVAIGIIFFTIVWLRKKKTLAKGFKWPKRWKR